MKIHTSVFSAILLILLCAGSVSAQDRMPLIPSDRLTPVQKKAIQEFTKQRGTPLLGPFIPLVRSPELMIRAMHVGDYLRFKTDMPAHLVELIIMVTAREWNQEHEWNAHYPLAVKAGLNPEVAKSLAAGRPPENQFKDERLIYDFCTEIYKKRGAISDDLYNRAVARFGEKNVLDMVGLSGYYTMMAMVLNVTRATPRKPVEGTPKIERP
jgi:4-carboxymuconolactone decarboxylase